MRINKDTIKKIRILQNSDLLVKLLGNYIKNGKQRKQTK